MIVAPLCSSSAANSTFIGSKNGGVLIDVGCSYKALRGYLSLCDIELSAVKAVLITHEHTDHVGGLRVFSKNNDVPVYASIGTRRALIEKNLVHNTDRLFDLGEIDKIDVDCEISSFHTPHDAAESVGFTITCSNGYKTAYLTDLGEITPAVRASTLGADFAFIESNYEPDMLWGGSYNYSLKQRVDSRLGHLSNTDSADYVRELVQSGTTRIMLAHLSRQNNTPRTAYCNAEEKLSGAGLKLDRDYTLDVAEIQSSGKYIAI
jgi:phosphoribosyl 1,2-cyclic phosphodiesterase